MVHCRSKPRFKTENERSLSQLVTGTIKKIDKIVKRLGKTDLRFF